jgi:hypothetical protein
LFDGFSLSSVSISLWILLYLLLCFGSLSCFNVRSSLSCLFVTQIAGTRGRKLANNISFVIIRLPRHSTDRPTSALGSMRSSRSRESHDSGASSFIEKRIPPKRLNWFVSHSLYDTRHDLVDLLLNLFNRLFCIDQSPLRSWTIFSISSESFIARLQEAELLLNLALELKSFISLFAVGSPLRGKGLRAQWGEGEDSDLRGLLNRHIEVDHTIWCRQAHITIHAPIHAQPFR